MRNKRWNIFLFIIIFSIRLFQNDTPGTRKSLFKVYFILDCKKFFNFTITVKIWYILWNFIKIEIIELISISTYRERQSLLCTESFKRAYLDICEIYHSIPVVNLNSNRTCLVCTVRRPNRTNIRQGSIFLA